MLTSSSSDSSMNRYYYSHSQVPLPNSELQKLSTTLSIVTGCRHGVHFFSSGNTINCLLTQGYHVHTHVAIIHSHRTFLMLRKLLLISENRIESDCVSICLVTIYTAQNLGTDVTKLGLFCRLLTPPLSK